MKKGYYYFGADITDQIEKAYRKGKKKHGKVF